MTTKAQQLAEHVKAGTHRIDGLHVQRWSKSANQWVSSPIWRKDVVRSAGAILMRK